ncbi:MAG: OB-fold nucleic acid binding domain-containing protein [Hyphomicrobiales bacterium]
MIRKLLLLPVAALLITSCANETKNTEAKDDAKHEKIIEVEPADTEKPTVISVSSVAEFPEKAASLYQKPVVLTGMVSHVCKHGGGKLALVDDGTENIIMVFKNKNMEAFQSELEGSKIKVQGMVVDANYMNKLEAETHGHNHDEENPKEHCESEKAAVETQAKENKEDKVYFILADEVENMDETTVEPESAVVEEQKKIEE